MTILTYFLIETKFNSSIKGSLESKISVCTAVFCGFPKVLIISNSKIVKTSSELIQTSSELISTRSELNSTSSELISAIAELLTIAHRVAQTTVADGKINGTF